MANSGWQIQGDKLVLNVDIGRIIGLDDNGIATTWLRIVTKGKDLTTAYPINPLLP